MTFSPPSPPHPLRTLTTGFVFAVCVLLATSPLWQGLAVKGKTPQGALRLQDESRAAQQRFIAEYQAKTAIGLMQLNERMGGPESRVREQIQGALEDGAQAGAADWMRRLMLMRHLGEAEAATAAERKLDSISNPEAELARHWGLTESTAGALLELYRAGATLQGPQVEAILDRLGFYGRLVRLENLHRLGADEEAARVESRIESEAVRFTMVVLIGFGMMIVFAGIGLFILIYLVVFLMQGQLRPRFERPRAPGRLLFETFTLYLLISIVLPRLLLARIENILVIALVMQAAALALAAWPLLWGVGPASWRQALGLERGVGALREAAFGPLGYLAALPLAAVGVALMLLVSRMVGLDPDSAVHPITPMMMDEKMSAVTRLLLLAVAAAGAPLVEEIMFRGALYGAMRTRLGPAASIMLTAALFAGIHPQGLLGFFPLFALGVMLAALREWRGSLIAPIVAHACINGVTMTILLSL